MPQVKRPVIVIYTASCWGKLFDPKLLPEGEQPLASADPYRFGVMTPRQPERRGGHVALTREQDALGVKEALGLRNVVADFRPPNVIRIAPSPLYSTFYEIWTVVRQVREIIEAGEQSTAS